MKRNYTYYNPMQRDSAEQNYQDNFEKNYVFVIMPFEGMDEVYSAIKDECKKLGLEAHRVDENSGASDINFDIMESIEKAEYIIVDLSYERPNVYYELGYAHGIGYMPNEILLIAHKETTLHFDVSHLRIERYSSTENLRSTINTKLTRMITMNRKKHNHIKENNSIEKDASTAVQHIINNDFNNTCKK